MINTQEEYVCFSDLEYNGNIYAYLISRKSPKKVIVAREILTDDFKLKIINNEEEKEKIINLFSQKFN